MKKKITLRLVGMLMLGIMVASACTQPYSQAPLASPTLLPTGLFVSPFPSGQDPLQIVADLGTQTAVAKTDVANGTTNAEHAGNASHHPNGRHTGRGIGDAHPRLRRYTRRDHPGTGHRHPGRIVCNTVCNSIRPDRDRRTPGNLYASNG